MALGGAVPLRAGRRLRLQPVSVEATGNLRVSHFRMVWLCFGARLVCQAVRMVWAPMVVYIARDPLYDLPPSVRGHILSSFSLGYLMTQIAGGVLADKYGGAPLILMALLVDGFAMCAAPELGAAFRVNGLMSVYFVMGVFSGIVHPAYNKIIAAWVPAEHIGGASTKGEAGAVAGTLLVTLLAPPVAERFGWGLVFRGFGLATLGFSALWFAAASSAPPSRRVRARSDLDDPSATDPGGLSTPTSSLSPASRRPSVNKLSALADVEQGAPEPKSPPSPPSGGAAAGVGVGAQRCSAAGLSARCPSLPPTSILLHVPMWAVIFQHVCYNSHRYFFVEWMPTFFDEVFAMPPSESSYYLSVLELLGVLTPILVGRAEGWALRQRGWSLLECRRAFGVVGFGGMALVAARIAGLRAGAVASANAPPAFSTFMLWVLLNPVCYTMHSCGYKANYMDLTTQLVYSGLFMGFGNTVASFMTYLMPLAVGVVLTATSGDWTLIFLGLCALDVVAVVVAKTLTSVESVDGTLIPKRRN